MPSLSAATLLSSAASLGEVSGDDTAAAAAALGGDAETRPSLPSWASPQANTRLQTED
jgi:hypothetical protein